MQVKMKTIMAGPEGTVQPGKIIAVTAKEGKDLIAGGYAEEYLDPAKAEAKPKAKANAAGKAKPKTGKKGK